MTALSEPQLQDGMQQFVHEFYVASSSERKKVVIMEVCFEEVKISSHTKQFDRDLNCHILKAHF